jgi:hypothetical protein
LAYSDVRIIVASSVVPPFRFKAGGREISHASIEVGTAIAARMIKGQREVSRFGRFLGQPLVDAICVEQL